jgi:hypothetical protein
MRYGVPFRAPWKGKLILQFPIEPTTLVAAVFLGLANEKRNLHFENQKGIWRKSNVLSVREYENSSVARHFISPVDDKGRSTELFI